MNLPATVSNLDLATVVEVLSRHAANITDASRDLGVPASDLRRLLWASPSLQDAVFEAVESRLDLAEKNVAASLHSDDGRERLAASMFTIRNSARSRRRGWITSAVAPDLTVSIDNTPRTYVFRWRSQDDKEEGDRATESFERDGKTFEVPKYGGSDDEPIEGELSTPPVLIDRVELPFPAEPPALPAAPTPEPQLPKWLGPGGPPPLVAHLYAPYVPPLLAPQQRREPESPPQPGPWRRMSRGGYR
jgi:hypothetical protein